MNEPEVSNAELHNEIRKLREEVGELRRMLMLVASTVAMVEGQQNVSHTYLRRALAELESTSTGRLMEEYMKSERLNSKMEQGLEVMSREARDMDLSELVEHLEE